MPITINEMKMPNNCKECEFHQSGYPDWCDLSCRSRDVFNISIRPDWCPLEETIPVVRCKNCKWGDITDYGAGEVLECVRNRLYRVNSISLEGEAYFRKVEPGDFCAWGEKRENEF